MVICNDDNCSKQAFFNFDGEGKAIYCLHHKVYEMVNVVNKRCIHTGCIKQPVYNKDGEEKPIYCSAHKQNNMINVITRRCENNGCSKQPCYNYRNIKKPIFCFEHKDPTMIDVKAKRCQIEDCDKMSSYNYEGKTNPIYCAEHKLKNMVAVRGAKCENDGCKKRPSYNFENELKPLYCTIHKKENMVDIISRKCIYEGCNINPSFALEGDIVPKYCAAHKSKDMIDVKNSKNICIEKDCDKIPSYNFGDKKNALYCSEHKKLEMIDVRHKRCKTFMCDTNIKDNKYEGYCARCFIHLYPDKPAPRNYKTKEQSVADFVLNEFGQYDWITDKKIKDGCSKRRPDLLLDMGDQVIIVEVDENQHTDYDCSCENKRTMELSQDVGHRPMVFIRFNPDSYYENKKSISSCWRINDSGICVISKTKTKEWNDRLSALKHQIEYWCNNRTDKTVEIVQLFYDL